MSRSSRSSGETDGRITSAWRLVSVTCGSMATQKSSCSIASPSRLPPGDDSTGLPANTTIAADLALARAW